MRTSFSATLPTMKRSKPRRPCVPTIIRSARHAFAPLFNQIWNTFFAGFEQHLFGFDAFRRRLSDRLVKELLASRANGGFRFGNINVRDNDPTDG